MDSFKGAVGPDGKPLTLYGIRFCSWNRDVLDDHPVRSHAIIPCGENFVEDWLRFILKHPDYVKGSIFIENNNDRNWREEELINDLLAKDNRPKWAKGDTS